MFQVSEILFVDLRDVIHAVIFHFDQLHGGGWFHGFAFDEKGISAVGERPEFRFIRSPPELQRTGITFRLPGYTVYRLHRKWDV